jgi:hypothetical protein
MGAFETKNPQNAGGGGCHEMWRDGDQRSAGWRENGNLAFILVRNDHEALTGKIGDDILDIFKVQAKLVAQFAKGHAAEHEQLVHDFL